MTKQELLARLAAQEHYKNLKYQIYDQKKQHLISLNLSANEYEILIKALADELGI